LHTLVVELDQPDPIFQYLMANVIGMAVPPEDVQRLGTGFGIRPVGTGPYQLDEWVRGVRLVFKPNPYYSGPERRRFDRIEIMIGGDESTHLMMFERGALDIASSSGMGIPMPDQRRLVQNPRWSPFIERSWMLGTFFVVLNTEMPPLDNLKVRQAISYAVDKPRRLHIANGRFTPAKGFIPPGMPGFNTNMVGYPYNPIRARELLSASGVALPIKLHFWHSTEQETVTLVQGIQADLQAVGIHIELKQVTSGQLVNASTMRKKVQMSLLSWTAANPDPKEFACLFDGHTLTNTPTSNVAWYTNTIVDQWLDKAATSVDLLERYRLYGKIEEIVVGEAPYVFLGHPNLFALRQPWLKGSLIEPLWVYRFDRVWIER
jgi:ABC-type transport system substrate-binding protein